MGYAHPITFTHTLTNAGSYTGTAILSASGDWLTGYEPVSVTLGVSQTAAITLYAQVSGYPVSGTVRTLWLTATSGISTAVHATISDTITFQLQAGDDSDDDGFSDLTEGDGDLDADGLPNYLDTDSDADGVLDADEGDDSDGDGIPDRIESNILDTDGDGTPDYLDTDSEGDGLLDAVEGLADNDGDGIPAYQDVDDTDIYSDSDGDGIQDRDEVGQGAYTDTDGDGSPDWMDTDSDGDGIPDGEPQWTSYFAYDEATNPAGCYINNLLAGGAGGPSRYFDGYVERIRTIGCGSGAAIKNVWASVKWIAGVHTITFQYTGPVRPNSEPASRCYNWPSLCQPPGLYPIPDNPASYWLGCEAVDSLGSGERFSCEFDQETDFVLHWSFPLCREAQEGNRYELHFNVDIIAVNGEAVSSAAGLSCEPIDSVTLTGPTASSPALNAAVSPGRATRPIRYIWKVWPVEESVPLVGIETADPTFSLADFQGEVPPGDYYARVTVFGCDDSSAYDTIEITVPEGGYPGGGGIPGDWVPGLPITGGLNFDGFPAWPTWPEPDDVDYFPDHIVCPDHPPLQAVTFPGTLGLPDMPALMGTVWITTLVSPVDELVEAIMNWDTIIDLSLVMPVGIAEEAGFGIDDFGDEGGAPSMDIEIAGYTATSLADELVSGIDAVFSYLRGVEDIGVIGPTVATLVIGIAWITFIAMVKIVVKPLLFSVHLVLEIWRLLPFT